MSQVAPQTIASGPTVDRAQAGPAWDWRVAPARGDTDAATARAAHAQRIAWRLANPEAWRAELARLDHYAPEYAYDPGHEYEHDWTTDHLYVFEDLVLSRMEYDRDGFVSRIEMRHKLLQVAIAATLSALLAGRGRQAVVEPRLYFDSDTYVGDVVRPDVAVSPLPSEPPAGRDEDTTYNIRLEEGDPVPDMVMEITSPSSRHNDLNEKLELYADLGIAEYLVFDGRTTPRAPILLIAHRLQEDGTYDRLPNVAITGSQVPAYFSSELATYIRLVQPTAEALNESAGAPPRFQWWDADRDRWRDRDSDGEYALRESEARGETRGRAEERINLLRTLLDGVVPRPDLDRIADAWRRDGPPDDAALRVRAVLAAPRDWRSLLDVRTADREQDADAPPPARDAGPRRGGQQW